MNILQDFKQNQFHQQPKMSKSSSASLNKKVTASKSTNSYQIQMNIGIAYNQILQLVKLNGFNKQVKLPEDGVKSIQKLDLIKKTVQMLIENAKKNASSSAKNNPSPQQNQVMDQSNIITCLDCQNYQNNLQKLQHQVRQHIRLQQQLKIYQQSMQQKIQQMKKQKSQHDKKYQDLKRKYEQQKQSSHSGSQKLHKLQFEIQKLKAENKQLLKQQSLSTYQTNKKIKGYESREKQNRMHQKQNRMDWAHRMSSINKKDEKQGLNKDKTHSHHNTDRNSNNNERTDRKSMQKRGGESTERWRMSNARSTKLISFNDKIIQQKNKEQRKKAIQSKFQYRR